MGKSRPRKHRAEAPTRDPHAKAGFTALASVLTVITVVLVAAGSLFTPSGASTPRIHRFPTKTVTATKTATAPAPRHRDGDGRRHRHPGRTDQDGDRCPDRPDGDRHPVGHATLHRRSRRQGPHRLHAAVGRPLPGLRPAARQRGGPHDLRATDPHVDEDGPDDRHQPAQADPDRWPVGRHRRCRRPRRLHRPGHRPDAQPQRLRRDRGRLRQRLPGPRRQGDRHPRLRLQAAR